jgi:hypothetical protein
MEERPGGTPRWVKAFAAVAAVLLLVAVVVKIVGGGEHGPGRHSFTGPPPAHAPASHP